MQQFLSVLTYLAVLGNVFFAAFITAMPADQKLPWWVLGLVAAVNATVHALPSSGLPLTVNPAAPKPPAA